MEAISVGPWGSEEGAPFSHRSNEGRRIKKIVLQYEGGFKSISLKYAPLISSETPECSKHNEVTQVTIVKSTEERVNIIKDSDYSLGIGKYWCLNCEKEHHAEVVSMPTGDAHNNYAIVSNRKGHWHNIEQDITSGVCVGGLYEISAQVTVKGGDDKEFEMWAGIKINRPDKTWYLLHFGRVFVKNLQWKKIESYFFLNMVFKNVVFFWDGPPPHVDLMIGPVSIYPVTKQFVIKLDQTEYLTHITGYYRKIQKEMPEVISSLTFFTSNGRKFGPFGSEEGTLFSLKSSDGEIIGFHGTSDRFLNSIGCHVKPIGPAIDDVRSESSSMLLDSSHRSPLNMKKELMLPSCEWPLDPGPWGGSNGKPFDDGFNERIIQILMTVSGKFLSSIQFEYESHGEVVRSARRGSLVLEKEVRRIKFDDPEEFLVLLTGFWDFTDEFQNNGAITSLTFYSNRTKYGPVGEEVGRFFSSPAAAGQVRGFFGRAGKFLNAIGVHLEYLDSLPRDVSTTSPLPALPLSSNGDNPKNSERTNFVRIDLPIEKSCGI